MSNAELKNGLSTTTCVSLSEVFKYEPFNNFYGRLSCQKSET